MDIISKSSNRILVGTTNKIDLTEYTKIYVEASYDSSNSQVGIFISTQPKLENEGFTNVILKNDSINRRAYFDISSLKGEYYIHLTTANGGTMNVRRVWLVK